MNSIQQKRYYQFCTKKVCFHVVIEIMERLIIKDQLFCIPPFLLLFL